MTNGNKYSGRRQHAPSISQPNSTIACIQVPAKVLDGVNPKATSTNIKDHMKKRDPAYCRATQTTPRWDLVKEGMTMAFDSEFQLIEKGGLNIQRHGRVSVVNEAGQVILDTFVAYDNEPGTTKKMNPPRFGVLWEDLKSDNGAQRGKVVEGWLVQMFRKCTVVLHDYRGDEAAFYLEKEPFKNSTIVDTQLLYGDMNPSGRGPRLDVAAQAVLGRVIQAGGIHCPVEDTRATMDLLLKFNEKEQAVALMEVMKGVVDMEKEKKVARQGGANAQVMPGLIYGTDGW